MNKFKYYFILIITTLSLFSCSKNDDDAIEPVPLRDFSVQFTADNALIEQYLKTYSIDISDPDFADKDVKIQKIDGVNNKPAIYSYLNSPTFPKLLFREVNLHDIKYKIYYLVLREGIGESPCNVDGVLASYKGQYLSESTVSEVTSLNTSQFEEIKFPNQIVDLYGFIRGWKEVLPQFKTGDYVSKEDGTVTYSNYGAGVMFVPSGMAYYAQGSINIPSYSPLVFSFKLYALQRLDHEFGYSGNVIVKTPDGVKSHMEDLDGDGYVWTQGELSSGVTNPDDSDGDGIPNFLDTDDDGDLYLTRVEIKNPATGLPFPFEDIPTCASGKKNFLDATCHP